MITGDDIARQAREYIGLPWRHLGRGKDGVDCLGLLICVAKDFHLIGPDADWSYPRCPIDGELEKGLERYLVPVRYSRLKAGYVITMQLHRVPFHVAISDGCGGIIHSYLSTGFVCEHRMETKWLRRVNRVFAFPGVAY